MKHLLVNQENLYLHLNAATRVDERRNPRHPSCTEMTDTITLRKYSHLPIKNHTHQVNQDFPA